MSSRRSIQSECSTVGEDVGEVLRLTNTVRFLGERLKVRDSEFKDLIERMNRTSNDRRRTRLWEQGNVVAKDLVALQSVYRDLMATLVNVKVRTSEVLRQEDDEHVQKHSCDSGVSMSLPSPPPPPAAQDKTSGPPSPPPSPARAPPALSAPAIRGPPASLRPLTAVAGHSPSTSARLRKLSGLSTAFSLYANYFYPWLVSHAPLVNPAAMEARWAARPALRNDARARPVSYDGFIPDGSPCAEPALWLLASVVAALGACFAARQQGCQEQDSDITKTASEEKDLKKKGEEKDEQLQQRPTKAAVPRQGAVTDSGRQAPALNLVAEVFDAAAVVHWMKNGNVFSKKCFAARLRADLGFWEAFARERGLVAAAEEAAAVAAAREGDSDFSVQDLSEEDRADLTALLAWLIGARRDEVVGCEMTVKSRIAIRLLETLAALGLQISWRMPEKPGAGAAPGTAERIVFIPTETRIIVEERTDRESIDITGYPGRRDTGLYVLPECESESDGTTWFDADTDDTSVSEVSSVAGEATEARDLSIKGSVVKRDRGGVFPGSPDREKRFTL